MKDVIIFVDAIRPASFGALKEYETRTGKKYQPIVLVDKNIQASITERNGQHKLAHKTEVAVADFSSPQSLRAALAPYKDRIFAVTAQYENSIYELRQLIPYVPYLQMPTEKSLEWATEKKSMRQLMEAYDPSLVPRHTEATDASAATIEAIEAKLSYPVIVKPSGLEGSLLVTMAEDHEALRQALGYVYQEIQKGYDTWIKRQKPTIVVEEFMQGDMYSIDTYVDASGNCQHTPAVEVITGKKVEFEDFFGYARITPTLLSADELAAARATCEKAIHALCLRSITVHNELMKTPDGWKVIEVGPRVGGYRHDMYMLSYGINHLVNDIRNRAGEAPEINNQVLRHTAVYNIYARQEGIIESINGIEKVQSLASFISLSQLLYPGEQALFAKNSGDPVFEIILSHEDETQLRSDMAILDNELHIGILDPSLIRV